MHDKPYMRNRRGNVFHMSWSKVVVIALGAALAAGPAWAQDDDDLLSPLAPKKKADPKAKAKPKAKPKPAPTATKPPPSSDDELAPLTPAKGDLLVKLAVPNKRAKVTLDDKELGGFPVPSQQLSAGEHTVTVKALGHNTFTKKVTIAAGKPTDLLVTLEPNAAIVSVSTDAVGATVLINGKAVGPAPIEELELPPGPTTISVHKEGYKDATQTVKLIAGKDYPFTVKLGAPIPATAIVANPTPTDRPENTNLTPTSTTPAEPIVSTQVEDSKIYERWYFWAGAAAVVAAVAVGTAVGVSSSQPKPLGEKAVCGDSGCDACIGLTCMAVTGIAPFKF